MQPCFSILNSPNSDSEAIIFLVGPQMYTQMVCQRSNKSDYLNNYIVLLFYSAKIDL